MLPYSSDLSLEFDPSKLKRCSPAQAGAQAFMAIVRGSAHRRAAPDWTRPAPGNGPDMVDQTPAFGRTGSGALPSSFGRGLRRL